MLRLSHRSVQNLASCHPELQKIIQLALLRSPVDFSVTEGHRGIARQKELFEKGLSKRDGVSKPSKHNSEPSMALDFCAWVPDYRHLAYDARQLCLLAGVFITCAKELHAAGEISHSLRWGGNWDGDGVIIADQIFQDLCHIELI